MNEMHLSGYFSVTMLDESINCIKLGKVFFTSYLNFELVLHLYKTAQKAPFCGVTQQIFNKNFLLSKEEIILNKIK